MSDPTTERRCDDCSQCEGARIHRDTTLRHFHLFSIPLMERPASDFPEGWPPGFEAVMCPPRRHLVQTVVGQRAGKRRDAEAAQKAHEHDMELIRRQAWKWVQEEEQREAQGDAPLAD
ncbi:MAG TPA: hypothetical protein VF761_16825 [Gemmatimonadaceae bacterium]